MTRRYTEQVHVHIPLVAHLRRRAVPGLVWFHPPNGAYYGGVRQGSLMKALGVRPGVSDLILFHRGMLYCLELKQLKSARASAEQDQFLADIRAAGGITAVCRGLDEALGCLEKWGIIIGLTEFALPLPLPEPPPVKRRTRAGVARKLTTTM